MERSKKEEQKKKKKRGRREQQNQARSLIVSLKPSKSEQKKGDTRASNSFLIEIKEIKISS
jgi:hypothetical protein